MDYIEHLRKAQHDHRPKEKKIEEGDLVLWIKIKGGKFQIPWDGPFKIGKVYNNNTISLHNFINDELGQVNINKLK
jgi:hypothetical protein